jgi:molybdopterin synthase sulfur carrier subunit
MSVESETVRHGAQSASIRVRVLLFAAYREAMGKKAVDLDVASESSVSDVFAVLAPPGSNFARLRPFTTFAVNREVVTSETTVIDGDEIAFLQPVSGGSDD